MLQNKAKPAALFIKLEQLHDANFQCRSPAQRLAHGRYVYAYEDEQQQFWLKTQLNLTAQSAALKWQLQRETACYAYFHQQKVSFCLPYQLLDQAFQINALPIAVDTPCLLLAQATPILAQDVNMLSHRQRLDVIWQMLNALQELHRLGAIHADLKAQHFVMYANQICLIDFEQVQWVMPPSDLPEILLERPQQCDATPRYMAPELFQGATKSLHSDLYALGIILLEWLAQQRLQAKSYQDWAILHCQQLQIALPAPTQAFKPLLAGLLAKQQSQRFDSIDTVKRCLITEIE